MSLPPHLLITTAADWERCLARLQAAPQLAIDLEANSMFAYQEEVCLIQISIPDQDYIIDPLAPLDLDGLGVIIADPAVEKIFHAAEYDLMLLKRQYGWQLHNLFDTMWAARILGYKRYGLANILKQLFDVRLNKRYQKSDWCRRPLSPAQMAYAQYDTHFLLQLRTLLGDELQAANRMEEAAETFVEQTHVRPHNHEFDPDSFWSISGVRDLNPRQQATLKALVIYRDQQARRRNQPHFKVLGERTLLELAQRMPHRTADMHQVYGMTSGQIRRYGRALLNVIAQARHAPPPKQKRTKRLPDDLLNRYDRLHNWRKLRAQKRGVESDVVLSRDALWAIARHNPSSEQDLVQVSALGDWRRQTYGAEIIDILRNL